MFKLGFLFLLAICYLALVRPDEVSVDSFGDAAPPSENVFRNVEFVNLLGEKPISIYWLDTSSGFNSVHMFDIGPSTTRTISTTNGHSFFASDLGHPEKRIPPHLVVIRKDVNEYHFGGGGQSPAAASSTSAHPPAKLHPSVRLMNQRSTSIAAKFRAHVPAMEYYYDDGKDGIYQGSLTLGKEATINTYEGHVFYFTEKGNKQKRYATVTMDKNIPLYIIRDPEFQVPQELLNMEQKERAFQEEYLNRTGIHWRHYFGPNGPRPPPVLYMWPADYVGQKHHIESTNGFWTCSGPKSRCHSKEKLNLTLEVISQRPRAFIIENFLNRDFEAPEIVRLADPKLRESQVGHGGSGGILKSDTRTSRNSWIPRSTSGFTDTLFRRAADLLQIDEQLLQSNRNVEDLQVVHYVNGQRYDAHHDWGVSGSPESRYITLLLYLTDQVHPGAGGETAFPKGADGLGIKILPKAGDAMMFYDLLEDGNGDDLSLHAALPVYAGEKWLANFWVWDPKR